MHKFAWTNRYNLHPVYCNHSVAIGFVEWHFHQVVWEGNITIFIYMIILQLFRRQLKKLMMQEHLFRALQQRKNKTKNLVVIYISTEKKLEQKRMIEVTTVTLSLWRVFGQPNDAIWQYIDIDWLSFVIRSLISSSSVSWSSRTSRAISAKTIDLKIFKSMAAITKPQYNVLKKCQQKEKM